MKNIKWLWMGNWTSVYIFGKICIIQWKKILLLKANQHWMVYSRFTRQFWDLVSSFHQSLDAHGDRSIVWGFWKQTCPISTVHFALYFLCSALLFLSFISWSLYGCSKSQWPKLKPSRQLIICSISSSSYTSYNEFWVDNTDVLALKFQNGPCPEKL